MHLNSSITPSTPPFLQHRCRNGKGGSDCPTAKCSSQGGSRKKEGGGGGGEGGEVLNLV